MKSIQSRISRRDFLKLGLAGLSAYTFAPLQSVFAQDNDWPENIQLGRTIARLDFKSRPSEDSQTLETVYDDTIVVWENEVIGDPYPMYPTNRRWIQTPRGYLPSPMVQPVRYLPNQPVSELPVSEDGHGMWAEVTVPYVDFVLENSAPISELLKEATRYRFYYSQLYWIDDMRTSSDGTVYYRAIEKHGSPGDVFWTPASVFRPITPEELQPIHPDVPDKRVVIDLSRQTLSCYEGENEVHFCRISSGAKYDAYGNPVEKWSTPLGDNHVINRKYVSLHMAGGSSASGYELLSVCWTCIFASGGVAIHSTYWHNNYGEPMSHGCVNVPPDDAKFIYLWSNPVVPYDAGKIEVTGYDLGTKVQVIEA
jgi:lipoprotein-anchoring transpeptidase ErfK/SrfK